MAGEPATIESATTPEQILDLLRAEMGRDGFQHRLDAEHTVTFVSRGRNLLVTFEKLEDTLTSGESGRPLGMDFVEDKNWSLMHFSASCDSWFRRQAVYGFLDRMVDEAFFEEFDQITFYGSGMCGYAAAAFSVVAPEAVVVAVAPQATLARDRAAWDSRFPEARRMSFGDRYGYAPDMLEGVQTAFVLYDPLKSFDAVHASLFRGPNVNRLNCRHLGDEIETALREMDLLHEVIEMAADRLLTEQVFYRLLRTRRTNTRFLRNLLFYTDARGDPLRTAILCVHVLDRRNGPAFRKRLNAAVRSMTEAGTLPEWLQDR